MTPRPTVRLPAEWEPQAGVQLTWPHAHGDWADHLVEVESCFTRIAREIAAREALLIACDNRDRVAAILSRSGVGVDRVRIVEAPSDDSWARDHAPITVYEGAETVLLDFEFNGWGGKYPSANDNRLSRTLQVKGAYGSTRMRGVDYVLEGGSIESDGKGTILTTAQCVLTPARNADLTKEKVAEVFRKEFGAVRVLWLHHGQLAGDDTDGHVDTLARFCDERTIAYTGCDEPGDEHFADLERMADELASFRTIDGRSYRLVKLPMPSPCYDSGGMRLPATYANFLIVNGAVLLPTYADEENDGRAMQALQTCFPDRAIVGIDCRSLILQHGSLHCATMHFPRGVEL